MMSVPEGQGFVTGRGTATAVRLLAAAASLGHPADVVRAVSEGYHVPEDVLEEYNAHLDEEDAAISTEVDPYSLDPVYTGGEGPWIPEIPKIKGKKNQPSNDAPDASLVGSEHIVDAADETDEIDETDEAPADEAPAGNASKDAWLEFAKAQPNYDESADAELGRDELKAKFAPAE